MLTTADSTLKFLKSNLSKSKTYFEILGKKAFRWHLEIWKTQIESIFKLKIKKRCQTAKKNLHHNAVIARGWGCRWHYYQGVGVQAWCKFFWNLTHFFDFQFKNTSNLIFPDFKVSSKSFFPKDFKIGLIFWRIWF